jgi:putative oxidoreductase
MKRIINLKFIPVNTDLALLVLRVWMGIGLFVNHGIEKFTNFDQMQQHFPNPVGIGPTASLIFALVSDAICSILIMLGVATRLAALIVVINLFAAFGLLFKFSFSKPSGEMAYVYLGAFIVVLLAGAGKYSIDNRLK